MLLLASIIDVPQLMSDVVRKLQRKVMFETDEQSLARQHLLPQ